MTDSDKLKLSFIYYAFRMNAALKLAFAAMHAPVPRESINGWYYTEKDGKKIRTVSIDNGNIVFDIPDDLEIGFLEQIVKPRTEIRDEKNHFKYLMEQLRES